MKWKTHFKKHWKTYKDRWNAKTSLFWIKTQSRALKIGASALGIIVINATTPLILPEWVLIGISWIIVACVFISGTAQFTKTSCDTTVDVEVKKENTNNI